MTIAQHLDRIIIFCLLLFIESTMSLKLKELTVPGNVPIGTRVKLLCEWELGPSDVLYSVKWYKDGREFFRYVPRDIEPLRKFQLPGVKVEDSDETGANLVLYPATLETGGRYRCEVSGEGPLFPTVSDHEDMKIFVLPDHGPVLSGFKPRYRIGDRVRVNCTSGRSLPATQLTWYINGEPAPVTSQQRVKKHEDGLESTSILLDFIVTEQHFKGSGIKVKCLATLAAIYWRSNEESALKERDKTYRKVEISHFSSIGNETIGHGTYTNHAGYSKNTVNYLFRYILCLNLLLYSLNTVNKN